MKPLSAEASALLERYKSMQDLPASVQVRVFDAVTDRAQRGDLPRFDVKADPPIVPRGGLVSRLWSSTLGKFGVLVIALGLSGAGIYGGARRHATSGGELVRTASST